MEIVGYLIPIALFLGLLGLGAFLWSLKSGQFDDLDGAAERILLDDDEQPPENARDNPADNAPAHAEEKPEAHR
jgi:cbb3-type cytochrome oxidase maturation protein